MPATTAGLWRATRAFMRALGVFSLILAPLAAAAETPDATPPVDEAALAMIADHLVELNAGVAASAPIDADPGRSARCAAGALCRIGARAYRFQTPPGWDGAAPLPVLIHFHGRKRDSAHPLKNKKVAGPAAAVGALLAAPEGVDGDWAFGVDDWRDVAFVDAMVRDLARHVPIDRSRVVFSGFSNGAAMAARVACARGAAYAGYTLIAGYLRDAAPADCAPGAARIVQVHGTTDAVYRLRPERASTNPATEVDRTLPFWRDAARCAGEPVERSFHVYHCREWLGCGDRGPSGRGDVELCVHRYGHILPKSWLPYALPRLLSPIERVASNP